MFVECHLTWWQMRFLSWHGVRSVSHWPKNRLESINIFPFTQHRLFKFQRMTSKSWLAHFCWFLSLLTKLLITSDKLSWRHCPLTPSTSCSTDGSNWTCKWQCKDGQSNSLKPVVRDPTKTRGLVGQIFEICWLQASVDCDRYVQGVRQVRFLKLCKTRT